MTGFDNLKRSFSEALDYSYHNDRQNLKKICREEKLVGALKTKRLETKKRKEDNIYYSTCKKIRTEVELLSEFDKLQVGEYSRDFREKYSTNQPKTKCNESLALVHIPKSYIMPDLIPRLPTFQSYSNPENMQLVEYKRFTFLDDIDCVD